MKSKLLYLSIALFMPALSACSDDDDNDVSPVNIPETVETAFETTFPNVNINNADWERKGIYYVADWDEANGLREVEAWFKNAPQPSQSWTMTVTDYGKDWFMVPAELNAEFNTTEFSFAKVDDISLYEYPDIMKNVYVVEVEPVGQKQDILLLFDAGTYKYLKSIPNNNVEITPDTKLK